MKFATNFVFDLIHAAIAPPSPQKNEIKNYNQLITDVTPKLFVIDRPGGPDDVPSGVCANYLRLLACIRINSQLTILDKYKKIYCSTRYM